LVFVLEETVSLRL